MALFRNPFARRESLPKRKLNAEKERAFGSPLVGTEYTPKRASKWLAFGLAAAMVGATAGTVGRGLYRAGVEAERGHARAVKMDAIDSYAQRLTKAGVEHPEYWARLMHDVNSRVPDGYRNWLRGSSRGSQGLTDEELEAEQARLAAYVPEPKDYAGFLLDEKDVRDMVKICKARETYHPGTIDSLSKLFDEVAWNGSRDDELPELSENEVKHLRAGTDYLFQEQVDFPLGAAEHKLKESRNWTVDHPDTWRVLMKVARLRHLTGGFLIGANIEPAPRYDLPSNERYKKWKIDVLAAKESLERKQRDGT